MITEIFDQPTIQELGAKLVIDKHALDEMLEDQPELIYHVGQLLALWATRRDENKKELEELSATIDGEIREDARAASEKITEREVEAKKVSELDRRLVFLNAMVIAAPLFGLLGTVLGMLLTFRAIGVGGSSTSEIIARGISEALVCTQSGMMVAIPGLIMASVAKRWRNEYVAFLARLESLTLRCFRPEPRGTTRVVARKDEQAAETVSTNNVAEVVPA